MKKKILIGTIILAIVLIISLIYTKSHKLSEIEKNTIEEKSLLIMPYFDNLETEFTTEMEKEVLYALDYIVNEEDKYSVKIDDLNKIINKFFNTKYDKEDLIKLGITPTMVEKNISFNFETNSYSILKQDLSTKEIAEIPITAYGIDKITKKNKDTYKVSYTKYIVEDPYTILNYYLDKNMEDERKLKPVKDDTILNVEAELFPEETKGIVEYLTGNGNRNELNKYLKNSFLKEKATKKNKVEVTYKVNNNKIIIKEYKVKK